jgi:hypothetical protein
LTATPTVPENVAISRDGSDSAALAALARVPVRASLGTAAVLRSLLSR